MIKHCIIIIAVLALTFGGCSHDGYAELGLVPVTGKVIFDGQPLAGAKVSFEGDDKRTAIGTTDSAGQYKLMYDSQTPGCMPGPKTVRITTADTGVEGGGESEGAAPVKEKVPARYNAQSQLKADVAKGKTTHDFELKTAP